jgi:hypothetical protein
VQSQRSFFIAPNRVSAGEYAEARVVHTGTQVILLDFRVEPLAGEQERIIDRLVGLLGKGKAGRVVRIAVEHIAERIDHKANRAEAVVDVEQSFVTCRSD